MRRYYFSEKEEKIDSLSKLYFLLSKVSYSTWLLSVVWVFQFPHLTLGMDGVCFFSIACHPHLILGSWAKMVKENQVHFKKCFEVSLFSSPRVNLSLNWEATVALWSLKSKWFYRWKLRERVLSENWHFNPTFFSSSMNCSESIR